MELHSSENKLSFIIDTRISIGFEHKGGSFVLHKLAYELAEYGHNIYVFNEPFYPHNNIKVIPTKRYPIGDGWNSKFEWEGFSYDPNKTVSILPQTTFDNPFNTINNVRWILHHTTQEQFDTFSKDDLIYKIAEFEIPIDYEPKNLITLDYNINKFSNLNQKTRSGFCHIIHKNTPNREKKFYPNLILWI